MTSWVGVDLSTKKIAFVQARTDTAAQYLCEVVAEGKLAADRFDDLMIGAGTVIHSLAPDPFIIEDVPYVKSRRGALALAQVLGGLRALCVVERVRYLVIPGRDWKRTLGLGGNANKDSIRAWVFDAVPNDAAQVWSQDLCDAYAISVAGQKLCGEA